MTTTLSPQARNRLNACLHGQEWTDLAHDIAESLETASEGGAYRKVTFGDAERAVILAALQGAEENTRTYDMDTDEFRNGGQDVPEKCLTLMDANGMCPRVCVDCLQPAYYDTADESYHHAYDPSDGCFLIPSEDRAPDYRHPLMTSKRGN